MTIDLSHYATLVFDCDGVVLNSNRVKTQAFHSTAMPYGTAAAAALVAHHVANGGISRYVKFSYFLSTIVPKFAPHLVPDRGAPGLEELLSAYAEAVRAGLMSCEVAKGLRDLRAATLKSRWLIASGGDQDELRAIFAERGLSHYFNGGIFGSPETKHNILAREIDRGNIIKPGLFIGDSNYDIQAAERAGLDFVFVSEWTEMPNWQGVATLVNFPVVPSIASILN